MAPSAAGAPKLIILSEKIWREAALKHRKRILSLLQPGLTPLNDQINTGTRRRNGTAKQYVDEWTALDPKNPIYNFLIEYYGVKGSKGPRRLGRWAPDPSLLLGNEDKIADNFDYMQQITNTIGAQNEMHVDGAGGGMNEKIDFQVDERIYEAAMEASFGLGGILLQGANEDDMGGTLHLRGSIPILNIDGGHVHEGKDLDEALLSTTTTTGNDCNLYGILYNPAIFYNRHKPVETPEDRQQLLKTMSPFQWYSSILRSTLDSEPILHCHGLHEWAMQYHPEGAPPPPSAKYQSSIPLRVSREVINKTVERKGISCTHVDALRFFAPAAGPLNHHGAELKRTDQLKLEQKACVHAHMDLLKIALKIQPFLNTDLLVDILGIALKARLLDVEASPYDARSYGASVVPVETKEGRKQYRDRQRDLMNETEPVRERLLKAYDDFMALSFAMDSIGGGQLEKGGENPLGPSSKADGEDKGQLYSFVAPERNALAQPGGPPWRRNLIKN